MSDRAAAPDSRPEGGKRPIPPQIAAFTFPPGQSGNPGGRRKKLWTDAYTAVSQGEVTLSARLAKRLGMPDGTRITGAAAGAIGMLLAAIRGDSSAAKEIANRVEGEVPKPTAFSDADGQLLDPRALAADLQTLGDIARRRILDAE